MQERKITLIDIGTGALPSVTPVEPQQTSWFPTVYVSPDTPPVEGVVPSPVADGVLIEWEAVDQDGVIYIIERGPTENGPWEEIARVTETRYLYSDGSGQAWWFKITASVRGKPGGGTTVEAAPGKVPNYAEMEELNRAIGQESLDRLAGDLDGVNQAVGTARQYTDEQVSALNGMLEDIIGADKWVADREYLAGAFSRLGGMLYQAVVPSTGVVPGTDPASWREIGEYTSVGDALAASISMGHQNASDIAAEAGRVDALVARLPAGEGQLATSAQVASESQARVDDVAALGQRIDTTNAALGDKASTAQVSAVETASASRDSALGQRIDQTNAAVAGKAEAETVNAVSSRVDALDGRVDAVASDITQVRSQIGGGKNLLVNAAFETDLRGIGVAYNPTGAGIAVERDVNAPNFVPVGTHTVGWFRPGSPQELIGFNFERVPVEANKRYCASIYGAAHRTVGYISLYFFDQNGLFISGIDSPQIPGRGQGGARLADFDRVHVFGVAPNNAAQAAVLFWAPPATGDLPFQVYLRPMFEEAGSGQVAPSAWEPGASGIDSKYAAATQVLETRATTLENGQARLEAKAGVLLDVNGRVIGWLANNDGAQGIFDIVADRLNVTDPNGTGSTTFEAGRWVTRSGGYMQVHGKPFGVTGDLMMYIGVGSDPNAASKANGIFWIDNKGNAYFGGSLSAGVLRNAVQTGTTQTVGTELLNGPFRTNGGNRTVTLSFSRTHSRQRSASGPTGFVAGAGSNTAQVQLFRQIGTGAWALWQVLNVTGSVDIRNEPDGPDFAISGWGGSFTVNDSSSPLENVAYRGVVTAFTEQAVSHQAGSFDSQSITQNLSIISVEQ